MDIIELLEHTKKEIDTYYPNVAATLAFREVWDSDMDELCKKNNINPEGFRKYCKGSMENNKAKNLYNTQYKGYKFMADYKKYLEKHLEQGICVEEEIEGTSIDINFEAQQSFKVTRINERCEVEEGIINAGSRCFFELKSGKLYEHVLEQIPNYKKSALKVLANNNLEGVIAVVVTKRKYFSKKERVIIEEIYNQGAIVILSNIQKRDLRESFYEMKTDYKKNYTKTLNYFEGNRDIPDLTIYKIVYPNNPNNLNLKSNNEY